MANGAPSPKPFAGLQIKMLDDPRTVEKLRILDTACFPVKYFDKYYDALVTNGFSKLSNVAWFHEVLVGSITSRLEPSGVEGKARVYIMTLGVLQPYRNLGIASMLLRTVLDYVATEPNVVEVTLHVQVGSAALALYQKHGFTIKEEVKDYYTGIEPTNDAFLLSLPVVHVEAPKPEPKKKGGSK